MPKITCVIPARLQSTRLERKLLRTLGSKPLLQWAWEGASKVSLFDDVVIAVDSEELFTCATDFGAHAIMTSNACMSGTDRLIELHQNQNIESDIWVNWQADEPFLNEEAIEELLQSCTIDAEEIWTLKSSLSTPEEIGSPSIVKVVTDKQGRALYFSRSPIPYNRSGSATYSKHVGLYAYRSSALSKISTLPPSPLEIAEGLEQLRFLEGGLSIQVHETHQHFFGIDTEEELAAAENLLSMVD